MGGGGIGGQQDSSKIRRNDMDEECRVHLVFWDDANGRVRRLVASISTQ